MTVTITIPNTTGQINVPAHLTANITSDIPVKLIQWISLQNVNFTVSLDQKTINFTPSANGVYTFRITADGVSKDGTITVGTVTPPVPPTPTPTPEPTPTGLLYDSNIHGKWNDGNKRTITVKEGSQKPNDKSIFCAASGSPKLVIDGDGIAHLVSGSGTTDNLSIRLRSRHQGECNNVSLDPTKRFGGHGWSIHKDGSVEFKTEDYHNKHSNPHSFKSGLSIGTQWHHVRQTCKGNKTTFTIDGKYIGEVTVKNYGDDSLLSKNSYVWLRNNNNDNGRIYIMAINIDSALDLDFKLDGSSIVLKNIKLVSI